VKAFVRNPEAVRGLVMEGAAPGASPIVSNKLPRAMLAPVAVSEIGDKISANVPIGTVPVISPFVVFRNKYEGKGDASYDVTAPPMVSIL
jgi:hypothetical protein